ncbi:MAG: hypothetical protein BGO77_07240 [Caedibacter sp. 37-49]|nr:MAG: hypothetical protein BGO77_07240 [Caedibacter sp. 37-49]
MMPLNHKTLLLFQLLAYATLTCCCSSAFLDEKSISNSQKETKRKTRQSYDLSHDRVQHHLDSAQAQWKKRKLKEKKASE